MSHLHLIRHGQASAGSDDYDQLSPLGYRQAEQLGQYWAAQEKPIDYIWVGTLKRHKQTCEAVSLAYKSEQLPWPEPIFIPEWDEYDAFSLYQQALPQLLEQNEELRRETKRVGFAHAPQTSGALFWKIFMAITRMWVRGELVLQNTPKWSEFYARVQSGIKRATDVQKQGAEVVVFTSGGPVAAAFGHSLNLDDERVIELSWCIFNASITSFLFQQNRFSIKQLNTIPHLPSKTEQSLR